MNLVVIYPFMVLFILNDFAILYIAGCKSVYLVKRICFVVDIYSCSLNENKNKCCNQGNDAVQTKEKSIIQLWSVAQNVICIFSLGLSNTN